MTKIEDIDKKLDDLCIKMAQIHVVLLGGNGHRGIVGQVSENSRDIKRIWTVLGVIVGSSGIGGLVAYLLQ